MEVDCVRFCTGSVKADNCNDLMKLKDVDGFLVGGASLIASDFLAISASSSSREISIGSEGFDSFSFDSFFLIGEELWGTGFPKIVRCFDAGF